MAGGFIMFKLLFSLALLNLPCIFEIQHYSLEPHQGREPFGVQLAGFVSC